MKPSLAPALAKNEKLFLFALAGIQFSHILDFMIMMPLGPQLIRSLHLDTHQFGLLVSSYTFSAAASGLLATTYIDRFDRRKIMLTVFAIFIVATFCCGLAFDFVSLLIARAFAGAFGGILGSMVHTMVADVIPFERRGRAVGIVMGAFSIATVAGLPLGLFLAANVPALGWRAPFLFIVLIAAILFILGLKVLPSLTAHLARPKVGNIFGQIYAVAKHPNHLKAFAFIALMMLAGFTVLPYFALNLTTNVGLPEKMLTLVYLCSGVATLFTSWFIGRMADRFGKLQVYRILAAASFVPLLIATHLTATALPLILINSTAFYVLVTGRMIPGIAMVSQAADPQVRGTFMSLFASIQMFSSGLASLVAGLVVERAANGQLEHYNIVGYLAVFFGVVAIWVAHRIRVAPNLASN